MTQKLGKSNRAIRLARTPDSASVAQIGDHIGGVTAATPGFDPKVFLTSVGPGRTSRHYKVNETIFRQGDPAGAIYYLQEGKIKLTVLSEHGKEAIIAQLQAGDFFGEGCLTGQPRYLASAVATAKSSVARVEREPMVRVLYAQPKFSEMFVSYLLSRNMQIEADLCDQLFNSSERRLARLLLLLTNFGKEGKMEMVIPKISQEVLAAQVGTTRARINFFMNKFRKLGLIEYDGELKVHSALLNVIVPAISEPDSVATKLTNTNKGIRSQPKRIGPNGRR